MHGYVRPPLPDPVFRDAEGRVIPYGSRWLDDEGPEDTYSVTAHPDRFTPYVDAARAIVDHLTEAYDVRRAEIDTVDGTKVSLVPTDPVSAPLTFVFTRFPMVDVTAGARTSLAWFCTCDHCDEDVEVAVENLEEQVTAVVTGGLREWLNDDADTQPDDPFGSLFLASALVGPDGEVVEGGSSSVSGEPERDALRDLFRDVPPRWAPWPLRPGAAPSP